MSTWRQPAYDAVWAAIAENPPVSTDDPWPAVENARVWRAVEAALDAMEPTLHELRAKLANAERERDGLREVVAERAAVNQQLGVEPQCASAWPLVVVWSAMVAMAVLAIWWAAS